MMNLTEVKEAVSRIYQELPTNWVNQKIAAQKVKRKKKKITQQNTKGSTDGQTEEDCNGVQFSF